MKKPMRQLGLRLKTVSGVPDACPAHGNCELIDVETGQPFTGITNFKISYGVNEVIEATITFYPAFIDGAGE